MISRLKSMIQNKFASIRSRSKIALSGRLDYMHLPGAMTVGSTTLIQTAPCKDHMIYRQNETCNDPTPLYLVENTYKKAMRGSEPATETHLLNQVGHRPTRAAVHIQSLPSATSSVYSPHVVFRFYRTMPTSSAISAACMDFVFKCTHTL